MHIAPESHKRAGPSSSAGTLPSGDTARKAGSFLEFPSRISTAMRSYFSPDSSSSQAMRNARVFWLQYSFIAALHYRKETVVAIKSEVQAILSGRSRIRRAARRRERLDLAATAGIKKAGRS